MIKKLLVVAVAVFVGLLVLGVAAAPDPSVNPESAEESLAAESKSALKARMVATNYQSPQSMDCVAGRLSDGAAQTLYRTFLYDRVDLTTEAERDASGVEVIDAYGACGVEMTALAATLRDDFETVNQGLVAALVARGR